MLFIVLSHKKETLKRFVMLTHKSKQVLKIINTICKRYQRRYPDEVAYATKTEISKNYLPKPIHQLYQILDYLVEQRYIFFDPQKNAYRQEYKGQKYKTFQRKKFLEYVVKKIIVPIVVTVITAIITTLITLSIKGF